MGKIPKLYLNPGHSDRDPGAVGYEIERELNVKTTNFQRDYLLANYIVDIRMNPGTLGNLNAIAEDANTWGADFFCSNHNNAGGGNGWEGLVYGEKNVAMGKIFEKHVLAAGQNSRGVKLRPGLAVLRLTTMPAILNEGAFVDNWEDIQDWNDEAELQKLAIAYAEATAEVMKLEKKVQIEQQTELVSNFWRVQVGAFSKKANAEKKMQAVKAAGFDAFLTVMDDKLWRVQVGAFSVKANADKMMAQLMAAGFSGYVTKVSGKIVK